MHLPILTSVTNSRREVDDQTVVAILGQAILDEWRQKCARWAMSSRRATPNNSLILHPPVLTSVTCRLLLLAAANDFCSSARPGQPQPCPDDSSRPLGNVRLWSNLPNPKQSHPLRRAQTVADGSRIRRPDRFAVQTNAAQTNTVQPSAGQTNTEAQNLVPTRRRWIAPLDRHDVQCRGRRTTSTNSESQAPDCIHFSRLNSL
jgi:hypothetical protein